MNLFFNKLSIFIVKKDFFYKKSLLTKKKFKCKNIIFNYSWFFSYSNLIFKNFNSSIRLYKKFFFYLFRSNLNDQLNNFLWVTKSNKNLSISEYFFKFKNYNFYKSFNFETLLLSLNNFFFNDNLIESNFNKNLFIKNLSQSFFLSSEKNTLSLDWSKKKILKLDSNFFSLKSNKNYIKDYNYLLNTYSINYDLICVKKKSKLTSLLTLKNNISIETLLCYLNKPVFLKLIFPDTSSLNVFNYCNKFFNYTVYNFFKNFFLYDYKQLMYFSNLFPTNSFFFFFKKKIFKTFNNQKFSSAITPFFTNAVIRFLEDLSGKSIFFRFNPFLHTNLTFLEKSLCFSWSQKLINFKKILGPRFFLLESLEIVYLALKLKDPFFLSNWMVNVMNRISFWKYKFFFRYIKYTMRFFFFLVFKSLGIKGIKFQLKGKISVSGNARTRKIIQSFGKTSNSTASIKSLYILNLVRTFTGVMGLKVWIFF